MSWRSSKSTLHPHKVGHLVILKSGGPTMTVASEPVDSGNVLCQWFVDTILYEGYFHPESLAPAGVESPRPQKV